MGILRQEVIL